MVDSGFQENDSLNNQLLEEGTRNYIKKLEETVQLDYSMYTTMNNTSSVLYPLWFGGLSYAVVKNYTRPRSVYFRAIWTVIPALTG